jgi:hypothetical protein
MSQTSGEVDAVVTHGTEESVEPRLRPVGPAPVAALRQEEPAPADVHLPQDFVMEEGSVEELLPRLGRLERRLRLQTVAMVLAVGAVALFALYHFVGEDVIVRQTLMESREITLRDNDGAPRLFIRMYSKVPVLQIMDSNGKPRMSLGLRFDDTPFIDLSDKRGRTRATFEMTEDDSPAMRLFDENGTPTFNIN